MHAAVYTGPSLDLPEHVQYTCTVLGCLLPGHTAGIPLHHVIACQQYFRPRGFILSLAQAFSVVCYIIETCPFVLPVMQPVLRRSGFAHCSEFLSALKDMSLRTQHAPGAGYVLHVRPGGPAAIAVVLWSCHVCCACSCVFVAWRRCCVVLLNTCNVWVWRAACGSAVQVAPRSQWYCTLICKI